MDSLQKQTLLIWDELVKMTQAENPTMQYGDFVEKHSLGAPVDIGHKLAPIFYFCRCNNLPILSDLLYNKGTGRPSNRQDISEAKYQELVAGVCSFFWAERFRDQLVSFVDAPE